MKKTFLRISCFINWVAVAVFVFFVVAGFVGLGEGGGALAGLATVIALTSFLWAPIVLVTSLASFISAYRRARRESRWGLVFKDPGTYVLALVLYVLSLMFF